MKCQFCGKEYVKNTADLSYMPEFMQEKLKYIPACNCLEKLHAVSYTHLTLPTT